MNKIIRRFAVFVMLICCAAVSAQAQVIPQSERAGRERERFSEPAPPAAQPGGPAVTLPGAVAPDGADKITLHLNAVKVEGSTVYKPQDFNSAFAGLVGTRITLREVYAIAQRITAMYGRDGYVLSRAIVPPQQINEHAAVIQIQVVEGYIDRVEWPRAKLARYIDFFSTYEARILADRPINAKTLERNLLLANDLPGLRFTTSLKPSATTRNASTLVVEVTEKPIDFEARFDNRGTQARGPNQFWTSANFNNLLGAHEQLNVTWAGAEQLKELQYFAVSAKKVFTADGLYGFATFSTGFGKPGTFALETLQFKTKSTTGEAGLAYPVIRLRERNLTVSGLMFASDSKSDILSFPFNDDRLRGFRLRADGDFADPLLGINQINVTLSQGIHGLGSSDNGNLLASRAAGKVDFTKFEGQFARLQSLPAGFSAFASIYGQTSGSALLAPEQCGYGGRFFGRAYDPSELLADRCVFVNGELRYNIPLPANVVIQRAQLYGFADHGSLWTVDAPFGVPAGQHAASAGGGVRLNWLNYLASDLTVAQAISGPRRDETRFFFAVSGKY